MWPFKKRDKTKAVKVPPEVQKYYESEHRERVGLAWLVAFVSLLITVLVIFGVFFGGRWLYRKTANKDRATTTQTTNNLPATQPTPGPDSKDKQPTSTDDSSNETSSNTPKDTSSTTGTSPSERETTSSNASSTASQPATGNLADTGPGDILVIFLATVAAGTILHWLVTRIKQTVAIKN